MKKIYIPVLAATLAMTLTGCMEDNAYYSRPAASGEYSTNVSPNDTKHNRRHSNRHRNQATVTPATAPGTTSNTGGHMTTQSAPVAPASMNENTQTPPAASTVRADQVGPSTTSANAPQ